eukprot:1457262-Prymnesium_polylepis.2
MSSIEFIFACGGATGVRRGPFRGGTRRPVQYWSEQMLALLVLGQPSSPPPLSYAVPPHEPTIRPLRAKMVCGADVPPDEVQIQINRDKAAPGQRKASDAADRGVPAHLLGGRASYVQPDRPALLR